MGIHVDEVSEGVGTMELEEQIARMERVSVRIALLGGVMLGSLAVFALAVFEFAKLVKYLWMSW